MKFTSKAKLITAALLTVVLVSSGCGKKDAETVVTDKPVPITVSQGSLESIANNTTISGKVAPLSEVAIIPKTPGKVAQVPVDVGIRVKKGNLLAKLDTTDLEINLSSALSGLQNAKITQNQAVLNYNNAKANYERMKTLYKDGAISLQQLEQAELSFNLASDAKKAPAVPIAQSQIDAIRNQISNATITSPIDGEIATRSIDPGEMASTAQPIMTVVNIDTVLVEATVAEGDIGLVSKGQKVSVKVDAAGGVFEGTITLLSPVADAKTKGYPVKVEIQNPGHKLKPGMFAEIEITTQNKKDALVVPKEVLVTRGSSKVLFVIENNVAVERRVETGIEEGDKVEITKGLKPGEKFAIEGQQSLFDKAKVTVKSTKSVN